MWILSLSFFRSFQLRDLKSKNFSHLSFLNGDFLYLQQLHSTCWWRIYDMIEGCGGMIKRTLWWDYCRCCCFQGQNELVVNGLHSHSALLHSHSYIALYCIHTVTNTHEWHIGATFGVLEIHVVSPTLVFTCGFTPCASFSPSVLPDECLCSMSSSAGFFSSDTRLKGCL